MANIISVSTADELMNALASATGGDTIELAGGNYGNLTLRGAVTNVSFDSTVTIVSADSDNQAVISGLDLRDASNLKFDNLMFDYEFSYGDPGFVRPFAVRDSDNITFSNSSFLGDVAKGVSEIYDGYGTGFGLGIVNSEDIVVENNYFETWGKGLILDRITGLKVLGNEITDMREDGMNVIQVMNAVIEENHVHNHRTHPEDPGHRDMIQLWVHPTHDTPSMNVEIRGNILDIGDGVNTQGIFMRNGAAEANPEDQSIYWQNITIENNTIYTNHIHGIVVGETVNLNISNNTLIKVDDGWEDIQVIDGWMGGGGDMAPKIIVAENSQYVLIENNVASGVLGYSNQDSWSLVSNVSLSEGEYYEYFVTSTIGSQGGVHNFFVLPDSEADQRGAGSEHIRFPDAPDSLTPLFQVHSDPSTEQILVFDASLTVGPLGLVSESDADFQWKFEDGSTATGRIVKHEFAGPGYHDVTLTVTNNEGMAAEAQFTAGIAGGDIAQFDAQTGQFEALAFGEETQLDSIDGSVVKTSEGHALRLGGDGIKASIPKSEMSRFFGTDAFELSMSLKADGADSWGHIALAHMSFITEVDQSGNFVLTLFLDDGSRVKVASKGVAMNDGDVHGVAIRFDGAAGFAEIMIDGQLVASENVSGGLGGDARDLMFGNPWNNRKFDGELSAFALSADSRDFPIYDGEALPVSDTQTTTTSPDTPPEAEDQTTLTDDSVEDSGETETSGSAGTEDSSTLPETDTAPAEPEEKPVPEEDSGFLEPLLHGGYELDIAGIPASDAVRLHDNAHVAETQDGQAIVFDGKNDYVSLGRLREFEESQKIAFSVDFAKKSSDGAREILVWNHLKVGLTLEGDGLRVHAQNAENHFSKGFQVEGLGLNDGNRHTATVMVDAEADRLQVVVNDVLVLDEQGTDFDFVGAGGYEWGWTLVTPWNRWFEGEVHDFQVSDDFEFFDVTADDGVPLA